METLFEKKRHKKILDTAQSLVEVLLRVLYARSPHFYSVKSIWLAIKSYIGMTNTRRDRIHYHGHASFFRP